MNEKQYVYKVRVRRTTIEYADVEVLSDGRGGIEAQVGAVYADRDNLWSKPEVSIDAVETHREHEVKVCGPS